MKSILLLLVIALIAPVFNQTGPDIQKTINKDIKILNLSSPSFQSNKKARITHKDVVIEIKRNFTIDKNIFKSATLNEYKNNEFKIREWIFNDHEKYQRIKEIKSEININGILHEFTFYEIDKKEPLIKLEYFTEKNYGLISYSVGDKIIYIKRKSKSPRLQKKFEEMCEIKKRIKNGL